jgi:hypothetical protein
MTQEPVSLQGRHDLTNTLINLIYRSDRKDCLLLLTDINKVKEHQQ